MLKSKERRDTFLFVFMAVIIILFLVYLFVPLSDKSPESVSPVTPISKSKSSTQAACGLSFSLKKAEEICEFAEFNLRLEGELKRILTQVQAGPDPFTGYQTGGLEKILAGEDREAWAADAGIAAEKIEPFFKILDKCNRLGFYDLSGIGDAVFPKGCTGTLRFNVYLACFLIAFKNEGVAAEILDLPDQVLEKVINLDMYEFIGNEIEKDIHTLPILFYFRLLVQRINIYPLEEKFPFFSQRLANIRDLSRQKLCNRIKEFLHFSKQTDTYRIGWREDDTLNPDDEQTYVGLSIRTFDFLKQRYLVFPDPNVPENNRWIRDLCEADSGDIELISLLIYLDEPGAVGMARKIYYDPERSRVVVVLKACNFKVKNDSVRTLIARRAENFHSRLAAVDLLNVSDRDEMFKGELLRLGAYLKKSIWPLLETDSSRDDEPPSGGEED